MKNLTKQYEEAKKKALAFMQNGQIAAYLRELNEMNRTKNLMISIAMN